MRRALLLIAVVAGVGLGPARLATAQASTARTGPMGGLKSGWLWPRDDFKETFGSTLTFGADLSFRTKVLGFGVDGRYSRKKTDLTQIGEQEVIGEAKWTSVPLSGNLYLNIFVDKGSTLYVAGGPTYMYTKIEGEAVGRDFIARLAAGQWSWGWNAIIGADSGRMYIEGQFLWVKENFGLADLASELDLGGFSLSLGYRF